MPRREFHFEEISLDTPIILSSEESVGLYLKTEENILLVGKNLQKNNGPRTDDNEVQLVYGSVIMNYGIGTVMNGYSWNGAVAYSVR